LPTVLEAATDLTAVFSNTVYFYPFAGEIQLQTEPLAQYKVQSSFFVANLLIVVATNGITASSTVNTRKNAANGNLSVSIGAGLTGTFEDITDFDSLAPGDAINYQFTVGATGTSITFAVTSCTLDNPSATEILMAVGVGVGAAATRYTPLNSSGTPASTEIYSTVRSAFSWAGLDIYLFNNQITAASTVASRKNGANGAQSVSIPGSTTGDFVDSTDVDLLNAGNQIDVLIMGGATGGQLNSSRIASQLSNTGSLFLLTIGTPSISSGSSPSYFASTGGGFGSSATEASVQLKVRKVNLTVRDYNVDVVSNTLNASSTYATRKNGSTGPIQVSVPQSTTGVFEDVGDIDAYLIGDLIDNQFTSAASSGAIKCAATLQAQQTPVPTHSLMGVG